MSYCEAYCSLSVNFELSVFCCCFCVFVLHPLDFSFIDILNISQEF